MRKELYFEISKLMEVKLPEFENFFTPEEKEAVQSLLKYRTYDEYQWKLIIDALKRIILESANLEIRKETLEFLIDIIDLGLRKED